MIDRVEMRRHVVKRGWINCREMGDMLLEGGSDGCKGRGGWDKRECKCLEFHGDDELCSSFGKDVTPIR